VWVARPNPGNVRSQWTDDMPPGAKLQVPTAGDGVRPIKPCRFDCGRLGLMVCSGHWRTMTERDSQLLIMVLANDGGAGICEMTLYVSAPIFNLSPAGNAGLIP
jgi:hypothetical protein